jgi:uncharacterized alkaline shock family protein YloU
MAASEAKPPPGSVRVTNEVIAHIASLTALQVQGVAGMYAAGSERAHRTLSAAEAHKGVRVELTGETLQLDLFIVIDHGSHVPTVAAAVQQNVNDAVDKMLGLEATAVNVFVGDVAFGDPSGASSP